MSGIGVELNKLRNTDSIIGDTVAMVHGLAVTIAPMLILVISFMVMQNISGLSSQPYARQALFSCTMQYIFTFSLLTTAPLNAVLSRYLSDVIYREDLAGIRACYDLGKMISVVMGSFLSVPFCLHEYFTGKVSAGYVFLQFCGFNSMVLVLYSVLYLSICKEYRRISLYYTIGMLAAVGLTWFLCRHMGIVPSVGVLAAFTAGFLMIAVLEDTLIRHCFPETSSQYRPVLQYLRKYRKLIAANTLYTLGLYIHNFVFWTTDTRMVVADSFVCNQSYDLASCLAMLTNLSSTVIFMSGIETNFHERYRDFFDAVTGGRGCDMESTKRQMFRSLSGCIMELIRTQFIIAVILYFVCIIFLPMIGISDLVMQIYPMLAAGYFIMFVMYYAIVFLYYYNDLTGAAVTSLVFFLVTLTGSIFSSRLSPIWCGSGLVLGALSGWICAYLRLRWMEKHLYEHVFCVGDIFKRGIGREPSGRIK